MKYQGSCFCGAVEIEVTGAPDVMGYCHCQSCRSWSGGPVNAFSLWKPDAVRVTSGAEHIATFTKTPVSERKYVYVVGPDHTAQRRDVTLGREVDGLRVVSSGLSGKDRIVVDGVQKVFFPGMPVKETVVAMGGTVAPDRKAIAAR